MLSAYRFQLRCKPVQERSLRRFAGGLRWIWNQALAEQKARYVRGEKFASYVDPVCDKPRPSGRGRIARTQKVSFAAVSVGSAVVRCTGG